MGWGEILSAIAPSLISGYMSSDAANTAAKQQTSALNQSNDLLWKMYQQNRADTAGSRALGNAAMGRLAAGFGFTPQGTAKPVNWAAAYQQDRIPAMINPGEARVLKNLGGAGVQNPVTGMWHFWQGNDSDSGGDSTSNDGPTGPSNDNDSNDGGDDFGGSLNFGRGFNSFNGIVDRAIQDASRPAGPYAPRDSGGTSSNSDIRPSQASFGVNPTDDYQVATKTVPTLKDGWGLLSGVLSGDPMAVKNAFGTEDVWDTWNSPMGRPSVDGRGGSNGGSVLSSYPRLSAQSPGAPSDGTNTGMDPNAWGGYSNTNNVLGDFEQDFNPSDLYNDPSYQWRVSENLKNLDKSAAAKGTMFSGQYIKDLSNYIQGQASQEYADAWNRYQQNRGNKFNMLATMAGMGNAATGQVNSNGYNYANLIDSNYTGMGNANAAGTIAGSNAWQNALNSGLNNYNLYNLLGQV